MPGSEDIIGGLWNKIKIGLQFSIVEFSAGFHEISLYAFSCS